MVARIAFPCSEFGSIARAFLASSVAFGIVVIFERDARQQFLSFHQFGVDLERFLGQVGGARFEVLRDTSASPISAPA